MSTSTSAPTSSPTGRPSVVGFVKAHGTGNDFVLLPDHDGTLDAPGDAAPLWGPASAAALASRHTGLGADGVIRVVRSEALPEGARALEEDPAATWFMDHRNADGSTAEMCGNGIRVLVAHLAAIGEVSPEEVADGVSIGTRAGVRRVRATTGPDGEAWWAVGMGTGALVHPDSAASTGSDATVTIEGLPVERPALSVDLGNPHTVVVLADLDELEAADLTSAPVVEPAPPAGSNVELVVPLDREAAPRGGAPSEGTDDTAAGDHEGVGMGRVRMRVHERGVGETQSCGTGACAAALASRAWASGLGAGAVDAQAPSSWFVEVPGGLLSVTISEDSSIELAGPAVMLAEGVVDLAALA